MLNLVSVNFKCRTGSSDVLDVECILPDKEPSSLRVLTFCILRGFLFLFFFTTLYVHKFFIIRVVTIAFPIIHLLHPITSINVFLVSGTSAINTMRWKRHWWGDTTPKCGQWGACRHIGRYLPVSGIWRRREPHPTRRDVQDISE